MQFHLNNQKLEISHSESNKYQKNIFNLEMWENTFLMV